MGSIVPFPPRRIPAESFAGRVMLDEPAQIVILPVVQRVHAGNRVALALATSPAPRESL